MNAWATLAAACCAGLTLWVACGPAAGAVRLRAFRVAGDPSVDSGDALSGGPLGGRERPWPWPWRAWWRWRSQARGLVAAVLRLPRARGARRRRTALWQASVIALCDALGAELRAGRPPEAAFAGSMAVLDPAVASALRGDRDPPGPGVQMGSTAGAWSADAAPWPFDAEVPALLERAARHPGGEGLRLLAACWRIGAERGGAFASVIDGLAGSLRQEQEQRHEISAQLAGPRATARLLAGLPLLGLVMAVALGARPWSFLLGTFPGALCLCGGVGLDLAGLLWTRRLAARAEPDAGARGSRPARQFLRTGNS